MVGGLALSWMAWWKPGMTKSATTQAQIRSFEIFHTNILIYELLEHVKSMILQNRAVGSPYSPLGNIRISKSTIKGPWRP